MSMSISAVQSPMSAVGGSMCPSCGQLACSCGYQVQAASGKNHDTSIGVVTDHTGTGALKTSGGGEIQKPVSSGDAASNESQEQQASDGTGGQQPKGQSGTAASNQMSSLELTAEELNMVRKLEQRDREVRAHEQAHVAAGGAHVSGGPRYTYQQGPDGKQYAIGGEVSIDTSEVSGDPEATKEKARQVRRSALAPANPSSQDQAVAAKAAQMEAQAATEEQEKSQESGDGKEEGEIAGATAEAAQSDSSTTAASIPTEKQQADLKSKSEVNQTGKTNSDDQSAEPPAESPGNRTDVPRAMQNAISAYESTRDEMTGQISPEKSFDIAV